MGKAIRNGGATGDLVGVTLGGGVLATVATGAALSSAGKVSGQFRYMGNKALD